MIRTFYAYHYGEEKKKERELESSAFSLKYVKKRLL